MERVDRAGSVTVRHRTSLRWQAPLFFFAALAFCLGATACTRKIEQGSPTGPGGGGGPQIVGYVTPANVQSIFDTHCIFCHSGNQPSGGQNLGTAKYSYANLVNIPANADSTYVRVLPGDPVNSYLLMKLRGDPRIHGSQMPLGDPPLDAATLNVITLWVAQGAPPETLFAPPSMAAGVR
jgi:hypothetical protein